MIVTANFTSIKTNQGINIFRYNTALHSDNGPGDIIRLIYMRIPGALGQ